MPSLHPDRCSRRHALCAAAGAAAALSLGWSRQASATPLTVSGARLSADFDPVGAMWLGYDPGHETFTASLVKALWDHVPIRMLVRDVAAEMRARALLGRTGLDADAVRFFHDPRAPFFVRDAAVFGLDGRDRRFIVDFRWTHYGWRSWCRQTFGPSRKRIDACARTDDTETALVDRRLAAALNIPAFQTPLAMEGGGVESNGRGVLIANTELWMVRNPDQLRNGIETLLLRLPGVRKVIWLPSGLAQDPLHRATITGPYVGWGTGGHTDEFVRFADPRTVLLAWPDVAEARDHPVAGLNLQRMKANFDILSRSTDQDGAPLRVLKVPLPRTISRSVVLSAQADSTFSEQWSAASFPPRERRRTGDALQQVAIASYLNHVLTDDLVLLPDYIAYGTPRARQDEVKAIYRSAFPGRKVQFIDAMSLNWFGGGAHCATLSEPRAKA